jgi:hypothetical protein
MARTRKLSPKPVVTYRFQRYYHALQTGHYLVKQARRQDPVRVFFDQGCIDSACGLHVLCSVLVIHDQAKGVALVDMTRRKYGVPATVFEAFEHTYFNGVSGKEFVRLTESLKLPLNLTLMEAIKGDCDRWVVDCLMAGELVAVVTASAKNTSRDQHWTLAVGVEGLCVGREHRPDTILLLDPSATEPYYRAHNARLRVATIGVGSAGGKAAERLYKPVNRDARSQRIIWQYESESYATDPVVLMAAVRFRLSTRQTENTL